MNNILISNRYRIVRTLGKGGFGETFLVEDAQLPSGRYCVLKQLIPVTNNSQIYQLVQERFQREAAILEELGEESNGQIPRLYAYFLEADKFYLVQEYIEGETLAEKVRTQGRMSEASVREMLSSILSILEYVHSKRIVHRDIKPDNIMLRRRDQKPVLIDFGAVKETMGTLINSQGNSTRSIIIGTPGFMPSEQAAGRPMYASDLYSLGLTVIYLLTGKLPNEFPTDPLTGEIQWRQFARNVSPSLSSILDKAILPNGRDRFQTARQMLDALIVGEPTLQSVIPVSPSPAPTIASTPQNGYSNGYQNGQNSHSNDYQNGVPTPNYPPQLQNNYPVNPSYSTNQSPTLAQTPLPTPHPIPVSQRLVAQSGMNDWLKAMLTGSLIGGFILLALFITRPQQSVNSSSTPQASTTVSPAPTPSLTPSPTPSLSSIPTSTPTPTPVPVSTPISIESPVQPATSPVPIPAQASISQQDAVDLVNAWLQAKRLMFAPPYSVEAVNAVTTGILLTDLTKPNGPIDWLRDNNAHYQFGVQKIESVQQFVANGDQATIELWVTEDRTLYKNGRLDPNETDFKTRLISYSLQRVGGDWKIADYKILSE